LYKVIAMFAMSAKAFRGVDTSQRRAELRAIKAFPAPFLNGSSMIRQPFAHWE
jgi:hypothetical protein